MQNAFHYPRAVQAERDATVADVTEWITGRAIRLNDGRPWRFQVIRAHRIEGVATSETVVHDFVRSARMAHNLACRLNLN